MCIVLSSKTLHLGLTDMPESASVKASSQGHLRTIYFWGVVSAQQYAQLEPSRGRSQTDARGLATSIRLVTAMSLHVARHGLSPAVFRC